MRDSARSANGSLLLLKTDVLRLASSPELFELFRGVLARAAAVQFALKIIRTGKQAPAT
jgi:hypothetical protein